MKIGCYSMEDRYWKAMLLFVQARKLFSISDEALDVSVNNGDEKNR